MQDFTRASSLTRFNEFAASQGLAGPQLLALVGMSVESLEEPEALISYRRFIDLINLAASESHNPLFGLQYGLFQGVRALGPLLHLLRNTQTVGDALDELVSHFPLHNVGAEVQLLTQGGQVLLCYHVHSTQPGTMRQAIELAIGVGMRLMQMLLGPRWRPEAILLQHGEGTRDPQAYARLLGAPLYFNQPCNALMFNQSQRNILLQDADPELHALLRRHLDSVSGLSAQDLPRHVQQLLRNLLPAGPVSIDRVADYLMHSPRSLQRHLAGQQTSYQRLLEQTRREMADRHLRDSSLSLTQLAGLLGYSDLSAFSRAFRRWYGHSPRHHRSQ